MAGNGSKVLIIDEPTRGIDVGAKAEAYRALARTRARRHGRRLMISSELPGQSTRMADRVLVMHEGRIERRDRARRGRRGTHHGCGALDNTVPRAGDGLGA